MDELQRNADTLAPTSSIRDLPTVASQLGTDSTDQPVDRQIDPSTGLDEPIPIGIKLPYRRTSIGYQYGQVTSLPITDLDVIELPANYTPYDLHRLRSRILPLLPPPAKDLIFATTLQEGQGDLYLVPSVGGAPISLSPEAYRALATRVKDEVAMMDNACLLLEASTPLIGRNGRPIPPGWVDRVLPHVQIPSTICGLDILGTPITYSKYLETGQVRVMTPPQLHYHNGGLYVDLRNCPIDPTGAATNLRILISDELIKLYERGTVTDAASIAEAWKLITDDGYLYHPTWRDDRFAPDPSAFLQERLQGSSTIRFPRLPDVTGTLERDLAPWHPQIGPDTIVVSVGTLTEAWEVAAILEKALTWIPEKPQPS